MSAKEIAQAILDLIICTEEALGNSVIGSVVPKGEAHFLVRAEIKANYGKTKLIHIEVTDMGVVK